jgi:hypothetical protein
MHKGSVKGSRGMNKNEKRQIVNLPRCLLVGGDGGELNPPSRRRTAEIYYKLIRAFNLAS